MKKALSFALAIAMCLSLAACGGGDDGAASPDISSDVSSSSGGGLTDEQLKALTEAYNAVAIPYNDIAVKAQENGWTADAETNTKINTISAILEPVGNALTGDMSSLEGANIDELILGLQELQPDLDELAAKVAEPFEGNATAVTDEALKPLANAYNDLVPVFNEVYEAAEANGWLNDEQTSAELDAVYGMVTYIGSGLSDDPSKLEDADLDGLTAQLQQFGPALEEIGQRVSVPYEG